MVKLTGDFHSVYYRTKDSLDDINRIMKSTIGEQIESVLQKPNYLELKLRNNLNLVNLVVRCDRFYLKSHQDPDFLHANASLLKGSGLRKLPL